METDMIKITHLKKRFGDVKAVNDLSFQVKKGELFAFLGVNGAGKSTLYRTTHYQDTMPRINTDEILRGFGDWRNTADLMKAGRIAIE